MNERERSLSLGNQLVSTDEIIICSRHQNIRHRERENMSPAPAAAVSSLSNRCLMSSTHSSNL